jgi:predicted ATPase/DNA-binding SARP family transcriptional activator
VEFGLLGPLEVRSGDALVDIRRGLPRTILTMLLLRRGETVSTDLLADTLWGDAQPINPANALQTQISYLRKSLAIHATTRLILTRPGGYALDVERGAIDACRFEEAVLAASQHDLGDVASVRAGLESLDEAIALWRGPALADVEGEEFAIGEAARLEELRLVAFELRNGLGLALGRHQGLIADLLSLVGEHPFREKLHEQLMLALYRSGRQTEALRAFTNARNALVDELGIEPGSGLRELERRILDQDPSLMPNGQVLEQPVAVASAATDADTTSASTSQLPSAVSTLVGRDVELGRLASLLQRSRLVTLTGPPGAGKTRLAIETARRASSDSAVWFVDLSDVIEPDSVVALIANALDVPTVPDADMVATVAAAMSKRHGLLVLDTCEHVVGAVAPLVGRILRESDRVGLLATSRRPLNVMGEIAWPVPPLALAPTDDRSVGELRQYGSVELFLERATAVRPDFELTDDNASDVASICMALDGLPLAIELAAARIDVLSPRAIHERLTHRFDLLIDGGRDTVPRQQTLRSAVEWSIGLLDESQRTFFARLGVFHGTFDLDSATSVAAVDEVQSLALMTSLIRQSMVAMVEHDRYRLLDTLGAYALEMLDELDADATRLRHAHCYVESAVRAEQGIRGRDQLAWLERLRADRANHRAALEWLVGIGDGVGAARLAGALGWFWTLDGMLEEADRQLERVLEFSDLPPVERSKILWSLALLESSLGRMDRAGKLAVESVQCARVSGDTIQTGFGLNALAVVQWATGDYESSAAIHAEAIALFTETNEAWGLAVASVLRTRTSIDQQRPDASDLAQESVAAARRTDDHHLIGIALQQLARITLQQGEPVDAVAHAMESLRNAEAIGYVEGIVGALHHAARALAADARSEDAHQLHLRALRLSSAIGHTAAQCEAIEGIAIANAVCGDLISAARLLSTADTERDRRRLPRRSDDEAEVATIREALERIGTGDDGHSVHRSFDDVVVDLIGRIVV